MGSFCSCCSSRFEEVYETDQFQEWMIQFSAMQLSKKEIRKLYNVFNRVDMDGSGAIGLAELLAHIDLERTRFTERIFSIFDEDGSGEIDFREFVLSLWNYCTLTKATLDMFAFDLYDGDSSGELSASEVSKMLQDIYGKKGVKNNVLAKTVASDLKAMEAEGHLLNIEAFRNFAKTHQALLFPAFQMQLALQRRFLGQRFWARNAEKRLKFSNGKYISVGNFILFNVDAKKRPLLQNDAPEVVAMHGEHHMDHDVGKLMEVAGTKAARRNTVMLNERRASFMGDSSAVMTEHQLFSIKSKALFDANQPLNETSKKEWLASILTVPALFSKGANVSSKNSTFSPSAGSSKKSRSAKNPKKIQVSQKIAPTPANSVPTGAYASSGEGGSGRPRKNSKEAMVLPHPHGAVTTEVHSCPVGGGSGRDRPRKLSKEKDSIHAPAHGSHVNPAGIATMEPHSHHSHTHSHSHHAYSATQAGSTDRSSMHKDNEKVKEIVINKETSKHRGKKDEIPSGRVKNPGLTMSAVQSIDAASPIEAWQQQPSDSKKLNISNLASSSGSGRDVGGGSGSHRGVAVDASGKAASNNGSAKPSGVMRSKPSAKVDLFEVESIEDDFNDFSSSKKKVRRSSLSKYDHTAAHNNSTFTDYSHLTAPADSTASIKGGGSKRGK